MAAVQAAGPEPMIIIFSAISFLNLTRGVLRYAPTRLHEKKNSIMHILKNQMRIRIKAESANSFLTGILSN
jgi:hypothetical protein